MNENQKAYNDAISNRKEIDQGITALRKEIEELKKSSKTLGNMRYDAMVSRIEDLEYTQKNTRQTASDERKIITEIANLNKLLPEAEKLKQLEEDLDLLQKKKKDYNAANLDHLEKAKKDLDDELKAALGTEKYEQRQAEKKLKKDKEDALATVAEAKAKKEGKPFNKKKFLEGLRAAEKDARKKEKEEGKPEEKEKKERLPKELRTYEEGDTWSKKIDDNIDEKDKIRDQIKEARKKYDDELKAYWEYKKLQEIYDYHLKVKDAISKRSKVEIERSNNIIKALKKRYLNRLDRASKISTSNQRSIEDFDKIIKFFEARLPKNQ
jgi:hypothetical protein